MQQRPVLVVEDRADWQSIVRADVERVGYIAHTTASYEEAITALNTTEYILLIIDPVLDTRNRFNRDGLSVLQVARTRYPDLPVIVITGSLTHDIQHSLRQIQCNAQIVLKEEWDSTVFRQMLLTLLGQQPAALATSEQATPPLHAAQAPRVPPTRAEGSRAGSSAPRILIVEDRADWQATLSQTLEAAGCCWRVAATARIALQELERERFHALVLDLKLQDRAIPLPSSEGWLLLDHVTAAYPTMHVVIVSGQAEAGDVADLLTRYRNISFIAKQRFAAETLLDVIATATRTPDLQIQSLGAFRICRNGEVISFVERPQAEKLVRLLLARRAQGQQAITVDELIMRLWPDDDEQRGRKKLLPLLSNARRILEPDIEARDSHFILRSAGSYFFDLNRSVTWDVVQFQGYVQQGLAAHRAGAYAGAIAALEAACALYQGDFLVEDAYADWAIEARRELVTTYCDGLTVLADCALALHQYDTAVRACEQVLVHDPLREPIYRRLMLLHVARGNKSQALKVYRDCAVLFGELFDEQPSPLTHQLRAAIADDDPAVLESRAFQEYLGG